MRETKPAHPQGQSQVDYSIRPRAADVPEKGVKLSNPTLGRSAVAEGSSTEAVLVSPDLKKAPVEISNLKDVKPVPAPARSKRKRGV